MSIFDYMNHFWDVNENDPCSLSENALFFYLLYEANRQHWVMPFKCNTQMLLARLNTSKQNIMKAREGLRKRGLIGFSKGEGKGRPALYTLLLGKGESSQQQSQPLFQALAPQLPQPMTTELTQPLPPSKIEEKDVNIEEVKEEKLSSLSKSKKELSLSELKELLLNDHPWQQDLLVRLAKNGIALDDKALEELINVFFLAQEQKGCKEKEEADCRNYVYNWICYQYRNNNHGKTSKYNGKAGSAEISANRPEDYTGIC